MPLEVIPTACALAVKPLGPCQSKVKGELPPLTRAWSWVELLTQAEPARSIETVGLPLTTMPAIWLEGHPDTEE